MIEKIRLADGAIVLKFDGRLLASRFAPAEEAAAWLNRRMSLLTQVKTAIVLGAGSGYHLVELSKRFAGQILVIEPSAEIREAVTDIHKLSDSRIVFESCDSVKSLRACKAVRETVANSFVVLIHPPSAAGREKLFAELQAQLVGRDWGSLTWQWSLQDLGDLDENPRVGQEKLSIYDLEQTELVQNSSERERLLVKALRELVK